MLSNNQSWPILNWSIYYRNKYILPKLFLQFHQQKHMFQTYQIHCFLHCLETRLLTTSCSLASTGPTKQTINSINSIISCSLVIIGVVIGAYHQFQQFVSYSLATRFIRRGLCAWKSEHFVMANRAWTHFSGVRLVVRSQSTFHHPWTCHH